MDSQTCGSFHLLNFVGGFTLELKMETPKKLSFLSFNIGLLDYYVPGLGIMYKYPDYAEQRLSHVPEAIRRSGADIICLQECYTSYQIRYIVTQLADLYPYHAHKASTGWWKLQNGMVTLSKYPITKQYLLPFTNTSALESWFANKSQLVSVVDVPNVGQIAVVNIHTTAGGYYLPTHPLSDLDRQHELGEVIEVTKMEEENGCHCVVIGDYNCGPYSSCNNWMEFKQTNNYRDLFVEAQEGNRWWSENGEPFTWDPKNYLNAIGPHKELPSDRLDHIMIPRNDVFWKAWECSSARILFTDVCVDILENQRSTISDHYGLFCELTCSNV